MSPTIRIGEDTYEQLKTHAEPFVDTPDSVIRRLLGMDDAGQTPDADSMTGVRQAADAPAAAARGANGGSPSVKRSTENSRGARTTAKKPGRAPRGSLLADDAYELPILQVLIERGGRAGKNEVLDALEPILGERLTELDREPVNSGEIRWRNRAQFARLRLVQRGDMEKDSPRGIWEIAKQGRERVVALRASAR